MICLSDESALEATVPFTAQTPERSSHETSNEHGDMGRILSETRSLCREIIRIAVRISLRRTHRDDEPRSRATDDRIRAGRQIGVAAIGAAFLIPPLRIL